MFEDKELVCKSCGQTWVWEAEEQRFFAEKGFTNEPRCTECRQARRPFQHTLYPITCEKCGASADVLHPDMKLCRECYKQSQQSEG